MSRTLKLEACFFFLGMVALQAGSLDAELEAFSLTAPSQLALHYTLRAAEFFVG